MAVLSANDALGAYTIQSLIGAGGMGEVYRAHDARLDRFVAIKILRHGVTDEGARARFSREARTVAKLRHPSVVAVFDVGEHDGLPFLVMELVEGPSLATIIDERRAVPLETKLRYVVDICDALAHAHERGIIHRDVKPSNVLIDDGRARLADFGIALDTQSTTTSVGGSPNYFAPEQLAGGGDHRADLFALGALFYELLTGKRAFSGSISDGVLYRIVHEPAPALPPHVAGAGMAEVVSRALEKNPDRRFQSAGEFKVAVAQASGVAAVTTSDTTVLPQPGSDVSRFRRRLLESAAPAEIKRLKYEVDQYLAVQPYDVDGRMLSDEIERALVSVAPVPVFSPAARGSSSWRRPAVYASTLALAVIAVSTYVTQRSVPPSPPNTVATTSAPSADSPPALFAARAPSTGRGLAAPGPKSQAARPEDAPKSQDSRPRAAERINSVSLRAGPTAPPSPDSAVVEPFAATTVPQAQAPPPVASPTPSPSPAVTPPPRPSPPPASAPSSVQVFPWLAPSEADDALIRESIGRYEAAYTQRDAAAAQVVYPGVDARALTATFERYGTLRYTIQIRSLAISGDTATVDAVTDRSGALKARGTESARSYVTIRLRRLPGGWIIEAIESTPTPQ